MTGEKFEISKLAKFSSGVRFVVCLPNSCGLQQVFSQQFTKFWLFLFQYPDQRLEQFCVYIELHFGLSLVIRTSKVAEAGGVASVPGGGLAE